MPIRAPRPRAAVPIAGFALALLSTVPAVVSADGAAPADTAIYQQEAIEVSAARPRARANAGGSSSVELRLDSTRVRPSPTLDQVLRSMPLVVVRANSRGEIQPALRGGEDRQIAVLVDGVPITLGWDHRTDLSIVPLASARRVTLHRGLASVLQGPNVIGGAVEIDIARGAEPGRRPSPLVLETGVDHLGSASAGLSGGWARPAQGGQWIARAGLGWRGDDGFALPRELDRGDPATRARLTSDGDRRLNSDVESLSGFLSLRRITDAGAWLSLSASGYRAERGVPPEANVADPRLWRYPYQARALGALSAGSGMRETPWGRGDLEASLGLDVGRTEIDAFDALDYRNVVDGERDDDRTITARLLGDHTLGGRGDFRGAATFAEVSHDEEFADGTGGSYRQRLWSLAGETEWRFGTRNVGGIPVRLSLGGAADGAETPESADKPPLGRLWDWGARAGATAVLREGRLLAHAALSRRARFPALRELYSGALGRFLPNPGLEPEKMLVGEAGFTLRSRGSELQVVGFRQVLADGITRVTVATPGGNKFQRVNRDEIRSHGLEVVGAIPVGPVTLGADATWQRVRAVDAAGAEQELEYEPALTGGLRCDAALPWRLNAGLELRHLGAQRALNPDTGALVELPAAGRLDARIARGFAFGPGPLRRVDVSFAVENLLDESVFDQAGLPQAGRTFRTQMRFW